MAQTSGPLVGQPFTDEQWRAIMGGEPGIVGDNTGASYGLALATGSDTATVGHATQDSTSVVAGFMHQVPAGVGEGVTIPAASGSARTDIITVRYDPTWTTDPGPCRLYRIAGTPGAGLPTYDAGPPGVEDMPLWAITRNPGESLSQAKTRDLRTWTGPNIVVRTVDDLATLRPLGTRARVLSESADYVRVLDAQNAPTWSRTPPATVTGTITLGGLYQGYGNPYSAPKVSHTGGEAKLYGMIRNRVTQQAPNITFSPSSLYTIGTIPAEFRPPPNNDQPRLVATSHGAGYLYVFANGNVQYQPFEVVNQATLWWLNFGGVTWER